MHVNQLRSGGRRHATILILGLAVAGLAVACSPAVAITPSPSSAAAPSTAVGSANPVPSATPSPSPTPSASVRPIVGLAPSGPWTSISWISAGAVIPLRPPNVSVYGWSGGYVALDQNGGQDPDGNEIPVVIRASTSTDGIRWGAPTAIETAGLVGLIEISAIVEGPSGLLALGYPYGDTCGGPASVVALWTSPDGRAWKRVSLPKDFRTGEVHTISGGSAGFIATGGSPDGSTHALWTSLDGRAWTSRPLPKVSSGTLVLDGATSFAGGFVLAGAVIGEGGCGGPAHIHTATWWSADGVAWSRSALPGSMTDANAGIGVHEISDRVVVVTQSSPDGSKLLAWTSTDGRSWTAVDAPSTQLTLQPVTDGRHAVLMMNPDSGSGAPTVLAIDEHASVTALGQGGNGPIASEDGPGWTFAVGPTGILVVLEDGGAAWLGVPG
jgi:hypothetical protein